MEILILLLVGHFLPTIIAVARGHHNGFAIFLTNLLLGWTLIGWVVALIWSTTAVQRRATIINA
ncbi:superinfection immunity protein [Glycocaulis abyssi]|uniref:Superinfection immunity protein n=1 Tax=Glycocaulis abyssi TaxID=1433403 RepID=A0ABV9NA91_9PROT